MADGGDDKKPTFKPNFGGQSKKSAHAKAAQARQRRSANEDERKSAQGRGGKGKGKGGKGKGKGSEGGKGGRGKLPIQGQAWLTGSSASETAIRIKPSTSSLSAAVKPEHDDENDDRDILMKDDLVNVTDVTPSQEPVVKVQGMADPWQPVQVPYYNSPDDQPPLFETTQTVTEEDDLYFLQLPTVLPPVSLDRLRTDRHGGIAKEMLSKDGSSDNAGIVGGSLNVSAGSGDHCQGALGEISPGFFGIIKVHASGRMVLHLGDSMYELNRGAHTSFAQQVAAVRPGAVPISEAGEAAMAKNRAARAAAAAATFKHEDIEDSMSQSDLPSSLSSSSSSTQAAAAEAAAAAAIQDAKSQDSLVPRTYSLIGPITKRIVAVPVVKDELLENPSVPMKE